jgi:hypothetical protein
MDRFRNRSASLSRERNRNENDFREDHSQDHEDPREPVEVREGSLGRRRGSSRDDDEGEPSDDRDANPNTFT